MFEAHQVLRRLKLNLGAHSFGYLVNLLNQLALLPVYLHYWPKALYGEWLVLVALPVYVEMADFGMGPVASNRMCIAAARGDDAAAIRSLHTAWVFQTLLLAFILLLISVVTLCGDPGHWLGLHSISSSQARIVFILLSLRAVLSCQMRLYTAQYASHLLAARSALIGNTTRVIDLLLTILLVMLGFGVIGVATAMSAVYVAALLFIQVDARKSCPRHPIGWERFSLSELKTGLRDGFAYQLVPTSGMFLMQGMTLVVNFMLGPVAVVLYNTTRALCRLSLAAVQMASWAVRPELSHLYGRGDFPLMSRIFQTFIKASFWISVAAALSVILLGHWAIALLTHGKINASGWFLVLFALSMITSGFWTAASILLIALNRHRRFSLYTFTLTLLLLPLSAAAMNLLGLAGAPLALLFCDLLIARHTWQECRKIFPADSPLLLREALSLPDRATLQRLIANRNGEKNRL